MVVHTVAFNPQLSLRYLLSSSIYVCMVVGEGDDVADFKLVFVVVKHEMAQSGSDVSPGVNCQLVGGHTVEQRRRRFAPSCFEHLQRR